MLQSDPTGSVTFEAQYDYSPSREGEIELQVGDRCIVKNPIDDPMGWLNGINTRTSEVGEFPGTYCMIVAPSLTPFLPPKPNRVTRTVCNGHNLIKKNFTKPVYCEHCTDFVWGGNTPCIFCTGCRKTSHIDCHRLFLKGNTCFAASATQQPSLTSEFEKPINEWTNDEVLEWMAAAHLQPYILLLRQRNVDGVKLLNLTKKALMDMGMPFEFHCNQFMDCIAELKTSPLEQSNSNINLSETSMAIETHNLIEHTFNTHQVCQLCNKPMFGIIRQGIICLDCGLQFHRSCAVKCNHECMGSTTTRARRMSDSSDPTFCCNYNHPTIPPVMSQCITLINNQGLDTQWIYKEACSFDEFRSLRIALNQDPLAINMSDKLWNKPLCVAMVLKTFLLELPVPLIPFEFYDAFISLAYDITNDKQTVVNLLRQLPDTNKSHLDYLLKHLVNVTRASDQNGMTINELSHEFTILILRPHDSEISTLVRNLDLQQKVVELLISTTPSTDMENLPNSDFDQSNWLWPEGTRKELSQRLSGTPDGSFAIRPSEQSKDFWTLTVRKEGRERLIHIIHQNGKYGFRKEHLPFESVKDLVLYFRDHSLQDYNPALNIKLMYPCGKPDKIEVHGGTQERYKELENKLNHVKFLELKLAEQETALEDCKGLCESQIDVVTFLDEQIKLAEQFYEETSHHEDLKASIDTLNRLLIDENEQLKRLDESLTQLKQECDQLNTQLTELSVEVPSLQAEYNQLEPLVNLKGAEQEEAKDLEDLEKLYEQYPMKTYNPSNTNLDERSWLFSEANKITRSEAQKLLEDKPDGTFLVRESDNFPFVISIVHDRSIKHIPVLRGRNGYGFAEPHNVYKNLEELVNHYHHQSLRMHNRQLDTTLAFPVRFLDQSDEAIYE